MQPTPSKQDSSNCPRPWCLAPQHLPVAAFWGVFFCWLNRLPLASSEFWNQAAYGRWILANQAPPAEDPFMPLAAGMQLFNTGWLSQVVFAAVGDWGGAEALSLLFATVVMAAFLILARAFYLQSRSLLVAHLGVLVVVFVGRSRIPEAQPDIFGMLCLATLLWLLVRERAAESDAAAGSWQPVSRPWSSWFGIPLLLALWANLHGSFVWGLLILVLWFAGAVAEAVWRRPTLGSIIGDPAVRRRLWLCELGVAATLLNPYGVRLVLYQAWFADYRQLSDLPAWQPLVLSQPGGRELIASLLVAMVMFRFSRRRLPVTDVLLLAAFSSVFGGGVRMAWWYAAVFGTVITPHLADLVARGAERASCGLSVRPGKTDRRWVRWEGGRKVSYSLIALGLAWICFALSPAWNAWMGGHPRSPERLYGGATPWKLTRYLRDNPPQGQVYHPHWWGGWMIWEGPPGLRPFLTTNLHLAPPKVWIDYRIIRETRTGWADVLARYGTRTVVLDRRRQTTLHRYLRGSDQWEQHYEDELAVVFGLVKGKPIDDKPMLTAADEGSIDD